MSRAKTRTTEVTTASDPDRCLRPSRPDDVGAARVRTEELYGRHGRVVLGLCSALLRDRAEAEDAAQQTFLSAQRALANGAVPREPAAWLATIARNECWARIRSRVREPLPTAEVEREASATDPVAEAIRRADLAALWDAIAELPKAQRNALLLREFGGLTYEELATALAVTTPAVESLLFRARQGLRIRFGNAYAALSGATWVEWAARLIAGSSAPAAAKVAAVGISAGVVTGGVVATPRVLHHQGASSHPAETATTEAHVRVPAPILVSDVAALAPAPSMRPRTVAHHDEHGPRGNDDDHSDSSGNPGARQGGHDGEHAGGSGPETTEVGDVEHGGHGSVGGAGDGPSGGGESGHHGLSGHSGRGGGDDEGMPSAGQNPVLSVTVMTTEDAVDGPL